VAQTGALPETPGVPGSAILQMLCALALIVGLLFLVAFLLRRFGGRAFGNTGAMRLVGGLALGPRERIVLVEIEETWLVVGIVPGQIKTLHTLPKGEPPVDGEAENRFGLWLRQISERKHGE
jgi:flagellar protein FliO/FliZ